MLDVATGGGHVARRLREAGANVVTVDPAPGMQADVIAPRRAPPVRGRRASTPSRAALAAHHFADVLAAVKEMARVAKHRVVICDNTFVSESSEEADRVRDPSHVRNYARRGVAQLLRARRARASRTSASCTRPLEIEPWLARVDCAGADAARVRELLGDRIVDGVMPLPTLVLKGAKR